MALLGLGNPLLDISVSTDEKFLKKYELEANNAILAEEKHMPMYSEMESMGEVEYIAGGATQNTMRVAQWIMGKSNPTYFFGSVGEDDYCSKLEKKSEEAGVCVKYQVQTDHPTGTCAVVITDNGKCRSLVANLAAANHFTKSHIEKPENQKIIDEANFIYISGFFLTVSPETIMAMGSHAAEKDKTFCMNLSAPFICEFFKDPMMAAFPYVDIIFGNETETEKFAQVHKWEETSVSAIAIKIAALPKKNNSRSRLVVITQGDQPVIVASDGKVQEFPVKKLTDDEIIDTNGAGDAFVGGYLAELTRGFGVSESVKCGIWAATAVIKRSGCTFPEKMDYLR